MSAGMLEYLLERLMGWQVKRGWNYISMFGLLLVIVGQLARTLAMTTAKASFTHQLQFSRRREHELVTHGIYSFMRHPSYAGFWYWGVGTQLLLTNPICTLGYALALTRFFQQRIPPEEEALTQFFGHGYIVYSKSTRVYIPGYWT
jgi:protein-S-isoprenylcysteine O-methyltransferase